MLHLAKCPQGLAVPLSQLAEEEALSAKFLQQLFAVLRRVGLVRVVKGFKGGFMLAKPADQITVGDILRALEGDLCLVECVRDPHVCDRKPICATRDVWAHASHLLEDYFDSVSLADVLAGRTKAKVVAKAPKGPTKRARSAIKTR
jgi:Rrf2 family protein